MLAQVAQKLCLRAFLRQGCAKAMLVRSKQGRRQAKLKEAEEQQKGKGKRQKAAINSKAIYIKQSQNFNRKVK